MFLRFFCTSPKKRTLSILIQKSQNHKIKLWKQVLIQFVCILPSVALGIVFHLNIVNQSIFIKIKNCGRELFLIKNSFQFHFFHLSPQFLFCVVPFNLFRFIALSINKFTSYSCKQISLMIRNEQTTKLKK